ncbi:gp53-like domain-containing protein [Pseudomonas fragi]|uniref:gp53-like domain-containing protein n=1 Tax=Pseudomonas fragi TaxID=296 RepID=UPI00168E6BEC|nr:phage tail protein [Pseudomonas fragi]NNB15968.1 phage tail protein [Pseudomonas fragi]NNB18478.1 phage tail protein [Pseudomonas fragi]
MQRISSWTDLVAAFGLFRYGTAAGGVPPTPVKAEWLNMVQEELANFILAYLPELDADDNTQLLKAIQAFGALYPLKATTLAGYGILDAYTKPETDWLLSQKAFSAITLAGYGIGDAYTKVAVDALLAAKQELIDNLAVTKQNKNTAAFGDTASWTLDSATGAMDQFGVFYMGAGPDIQAINFPVAFPTACRSVVLTNYEDWGIPENNIVRVLHWDRYSVSILNSGGNTTTAYSWIAKGN